MSTAWQQTTGPAHEGHGMPASGFGTQDTPFSMRGLQSLSSLSTTESRSPLNRILESSHRAEQIGSGQHPIPRRQDEEGVNSSCPSRKCKNCMLDGKSKQDFLAVLNVVLW